MTAPASKLVSAALLAALLNGCGSSAGGGGPSGSGGAAAGSNSPPISGSGGAIASGGAAPSGGAMATAGTTASGGIGAATTGGASTGGSAGTDAAFPSGGLSGGQGDALGGSATVLSGGAAGTPSQAGAGAGGNGGGVAGAAQSGGAPAMGGESNGGRSISFGTLLDAQAVMTAAQQLAQTLAEPGSAQWRAKGDQHRSYHFTAANADEPYRLYVPTSWDGESKLPLVMFLHGSGSDENNYVDQNNKQLLNLAQQHGCILVSPLGDKGAYGNFLRLASPFGKPEEAAKLMAQVTAESERSNELSEQDVINVLELVLNEYPVDRSAMFLSGHSMGSGGTWYIGGKYASYWRALAPVSGPFVQESGYPWDSLREIGIFVTEGTQAPSLEGSRTLRDWLKSKGFKAEYKEVNADHGGMVSLVLPDVFDFFDRSK